MDYESDNTMNNSYNVNKNINEFCDSSIVKHERDEYNDDQSPNKRQKFNSIELSVDEPKHIFKNLDEPVIDISRIQSDADFKIAVLTELASIRQQLSCLQKSQTESFQYMLEKEFVPSKRTNFQQKYNFTLPFDDRDDFILFNENLKTNQYLQNDVCALMKTCLDKNLVITKTFLRIIRTFMTKNLAMRFTACRKSRDKDCPKDQMKPLQLYKCMETVIMSAREEKKMETTEKDLCTSLSDVLSNVRKWDRRLKD